MFGKMIMDFLRWLQERHREQGALVEGQPSDEIPTAEDKQVEKEPTNSDGAGSTPAIAAHHFYEVPFVNTPNKGGEIKPRYLIIHWSASGNLAGTIGHIRNPKSKVSAHLLVDRDGKMVQMVPFNRRAWHCGVSEWKGLEMLNAHSIGIEGINWGELTLMETVFRSYKMTRIDPRHAVNIPDKYGKARWYHVYTAEQIEVIANASRELVREYGLEDVLGHSDISPGRKSDPGPAFPLQQVREFCYSDAEDWKAFTAKNKDGK